MPFTRSQLEAALVGRCGKIIEYARLTTAAAADPTPRAYMNDALRGALRDLSVAVVNPAAVADADIALVAAADENALLDVAEVRLLESAFSNIDDVTIMYSTGGGGSTQGLLSDLPRRLETRIAAKWEHIRRKYGIGAARLRAGTLKLGFAQEWNPAEPFFD